MHPSRPGQRLAKVIGGSLDGTVQYISGIALLAAVPGGIEHYVWERGPDGAIRAVYDHMAVTREVSND